jgi:hypothetical protein
MQSIIDTIRKYTALLGSRTAWTILALGLFNGLTSVKDQVPVSWQPWVNPLLMVLGWYFRANPQAVI